MSYLFEVIDKTGRKIRLTKDKWTHITSPQSQHPYMANYLEEIKSTLIKPTLIIPHKFDDTKRNYYTYLKNKKQYLLVSVKYLNFRIPHNKRNSDSDQKSGRFLTWRRLCNDSIHYKKNNKKMTQKNLKIYYDVEADILEIIIGEPTSCVFDEVDDDIFEAHDEKTNELKGYKIFNFMKRGILKNIKIPLPANIGITAVA